MLEQVTKCHPPETRFNNCTSQQSPWCGWYCTWAVYVPQPDRAAVPRGLTGCNIGHHSDAWVPSWSLESGLFPFVWINPWQFLDALGGLKRPLNEDVHSSYWKAQWDSLVFIPKPSQGSWKFCFSLESADPRHPASWATKSKTGEEGWGYSQCGVMPVTGD